MTIFTLILSILGLCVFEVINSIDNAIINAEVLGTMSQKSRRWFLFWGLLFAVVVVRGLLPWVIIYASTPSLGFIGSFTAMFSNDPSVGKAIETSAPLLLMGAGVFLVFLFFHWLFVEPKNYGLPGEKFIHRQSIWFFAVIAILLTIIVWEAAQKDAFLAFAAVVGSSTFFIIHGFKQNAEAQEKKLLGNSGLSDLSKIFYLEIIDTTFSIDSVLGAFAFTMSVPIILFGNGLGALVLRQITVGNIERIKKLVFLKNGAMYSILCLGVIMVLDGFGHHIPEWLSPALTFLIIGYFYLRSRWRLKQDLKSEV